MIPRTKRGEILGDLPFPCAGKDDGAAEFGDSCTRVKSGNSPTVPFVISPRVSVDGLSLDDLMLEHVSSINDARPS